MTYLSLDFTICSALLQDCSYARPSFPHIVEGCIFHQNPLPEFIVTGLVEQGIPGSIITIVPVKFVCLVLDVMLLHQIENDSFPYDMPQKSFTG